MSSSSEHLPDSPLLTVPTGHRRTPPGHNQLVLVSIRSRRVARLSVDQLQNSRRSIWELSTCIVSSRIEKYLFNRNLKYKFEFSHSLLGLGQYYLLTLKVYVQGRLVETKLLLDIKLYIKICHKIHAKLVTCWGLNTSFGILQNHLWPSTRIRGSGSALYALQGTIIHYNALQCTTCRISGVIRNGTKISRDFSQ